MPRAAGLPRCCYVQLVNCEKMSSTSISATIVKMVKLPDCKNNRMYIRSSEDQEPRAIPLIGGDEAFEALKAIRKSGTDWSEMPVYLGKHEEYGEFAAFMKGVVEGEEVL
jgi:hypothetical protein